jgi:hypothetical protein
VAVTDEDHSSRRRVGVGLIIIAIVLGAAFVGGRLAVHSISDAICGSYNFISNDVCDRWNYETPPSGALPIPPSWAIKWEDLDCGSGGCGSRLYVLAPTAPARNGVPAYLEQIEQLGWSIDGRGEARRGELHLDVEPATDRFVARIVPRRLVREENLFVSLALCGEGTVCE